MKLSAEDAFRQFGDRAFSAAFSATGNKEDADDVVQDTFLKYWNTDQDFADENHIKAWLLRMSINRSRDLLRSFWHRKKVPWEDCFLLRSRRTRTCLRRLWSCHGNTG